MPDEPSNLASIPGPTINRDPYSHLFDVAVIGGGMCGLATAIAVAAETGKDVLLVERRAALGWELTSALHAELERSNQTITHRIYRSINAIGRLKGEG